MKVTIRTLQLGKATFEVDAESSETISELKLKICAQHGYPAESQNIIDSGKSLQDDKTIGACNIKEASPLILVLRRAPTGSATSVLGTATDKDVLTASSMPIGAPRPPVPTQMFTRPTPMAPISAAAVPGKTISLTSSQGAPAPASSLASQRVPPFSGSGMSSGVRLSQAFVDKTTDMGSGLLASRPTATGSSLQAPKPTPYTDAASTPDVSLTLHPSMEEKQRRQWPNPTFMPSNDGPSFGASAGLSAPASDSAPTRTIVREEIVTPEEYHAIERLEALGFPRNAVAQAFFACDRNEEAAANFLIDGIFN